MKIVTKEEILKFRVILNFVSNISNWNQQKGTEFRIEQNEETRNCKWCFRLPKEKYGFWGLFWRLSVNPILVKDG